MKNCQCGKQPMYTHQEQLFPGGCNDIVKDTHLCYSCAARHPDFNRKVFRMSWIPLHGILPETLPQVLRPKRVLT